MYKYSYKPIISYIFNFYLFSVCFRLSELEHEPGCCWLEGALPSCSPAAALSLPSAHTFPATDCSQLCSWACLLRGSGWPFQRAADDMVASVPVGPCLPGKGAVLEPLLFKNNIFNQHLKPSMSWQISLHSLSLKGTTGDVLYPLEDFKTNSKCIKIIDMKTKQKRN